MEKSSGPRTEPWGTPTKNGLGEMSENQCALTESYHTEINSVCNQVAFSLCLGEWHTVFTLPSIEMIILDCKKNIIIDYCARTGWPKNSKPY